MSNERLRNAMQSAHIGIDDVVNVTGVDIKTVQRWLNGRVPHARHRWKIAELLKEQNDFLWPTEDRVIANTAHTAEIIAAYAHRNEVPLNDWKNLFLKAYRKIDLLGNSILFIPEQHSGLVDLLKAKAAHGCKIRIAVADPSCEAIKLRDEEEQLGSTLSARIKTTLCHFRDIQNVDGIEIRYHSTILYNSLFRYDNDMFVTPHLYGLHGSKAPLLHLRRLEVDGVFANFEAHFESVWATTKPLRERE